ncbi:site-2 protease family protein [Deferribacter autotrophicus]|uniref:Site-2 protease family protein n=1 Tax=Deferribacter autotrophicus TaxID=500465 RepID=A0A5A8F4X9_9BACT|nr:site-2 protease family protein [Deferribacter autotrophicus]KAA0259179.1 site-2 protease family protein [Deferribacter autotrophicus]
MFDINSFLRDLSIAIVPFLLAVTVHEASHGYAAYFLGDDTAKRAGRLTLNPFVHIDIFGLLCLLITRLFGWAKPVPVNFNVVARKKYGVAIVAAAGPVANFLVAIFSAILYHIVSSIHTSNPLMIKILFPITMMLIFSVQINIALGVFNLIPIPPLDGGRILQSFLPVDKQVKFAQLERYGFIIILLLIITHVVDYVIFPIIHFFVRLLI